MQSDAALISEMRNVLAHEAKALIRVSESLSQDFAIVLKKIVQSQGKVVLSGVGKSGLIARKMASTFSSTGTPSVFLHPTDALHGDMGGLVKGDFLFAISKSGETRELLDLVHAVKNLGLTLISLVGKKDSSLTKNVDHSLVFFHDKEACPFDLAPTTSTTSTLALGDAMALTLMKMRDFKPQDFALYHPAGKLGQRLLLQVKDLMIPISKFPLLKTQNSTLEEVITALGSVGLVLFSDDGLHLDGILTDGDVRRALNQYKEKLFNLKVSSLMTRSPMVLDESRSAYEALEFMEKRDRPLNVIPVVAGQKLRGVLRLHELVRIFE